MAKVRSAVSDYLVYLVVRMFVCVLQSLSRETAFTFARFLAWVAYHVDKRHRNVAKENIAKAFPGRYTDAEIDAMVRGVYRHFLRVAIEIVFIPRKLHVNNWRKHVEIENPRPMVEALLSGRPLLIVTGHFGNWEVGGYVLNLFGFHTHAIARPLDNPYMDDFLRDFRERTGQKILAKQGDFDRMTQVLAEGGVLATLADQDAGQRGLFVDFFGRPASTHKAVALMAMEHNVPMMVACALMRDGKYRVVPGDLILPESYDRSSDAIKSITQRFTTGLETIIRQAPEQYFWLHRRWKHQPIVKAKKKAA